MKEYRLTDWLPTTKKEVELRGWDSLDVILFSGDAYVDHPSFGAAVIGRVLEAEGLRVAIVPQPNWRDDLRDFKKLGRPRLFFGISAGCMDSMVNKYTANKRLRSEDAYTPDGRTDMRPECPSVVYTRILKEIYPDAPVVLGGIEASMRRLTHYDYWKDCLQKSILCDSGADLLVYGMGEKPVVELARRLRALVPDGDGCISASQLSEAAKHISIDTLEIDEEAGTVRISDPEASIDVGALGKGYATEKAAQFLESDGANGYVLSVGGNIRIIGTKMDGSGFVTGVRSPDSSDPNFAATLRLSDTACVTSGVYERFYSVKGKQYHHIIDKDTLYPARYFDSLTIVTRDSGLADALSTALFCMTYEDGQKLLSDIGGVEAFWIFPDGTKKYTPGLEKSIISTD